MRGLLSITATVVVLCAAMSCGPADISFPRTTGDHMVIQRGKPFLIEGTALGKEGKPVPGARVVINWRGENVRAVADGCGHWSAQLPSGEAGGPFELKAGPKVVRDIMVGDVYLCSGQSNMELPVRRCLDATGDFVKGYSNDKIRYLGVPMRYSFDKECEDIRETAWQTLDSDSTALDWGAVSYFTARELYESNGVPVGMINASVGGSPIEAWMQEPLLAENCSARLSVLRKPGYVDSVRIAAHNVYADWQAKHDSLPGNTSSVWEDVEMFSPVWSKGPEGDVWYGSHLLRKSFSLTGSQAAGEAVLHLGAMRDGDSTFVNGTFVGNVTYQYPPRNYKIPAGLLVPGGNVVEIHLYSTNNAASFVEDKRYSLETADGDVQLTGIWQHKYGKRMEKRAQEIFLQYEPTGLYNGMIAPLKALEFAGVIWYQGESNCSNAAQYGGLLSSMIADWRSEFNDAGLPFYIIELAAFEHSELTDNDFGWNRVQREQRSLADDAGRVYVVKNADLGEWNDIHPQDKKTLGERVARKIMDNR